MDLLSRDGVAAICLLGAVCLSAFLLFEWATTEKVTRPAWRWGDPQRRPDPLQGLATHVVGFVCVVLLVGSLLA